MADTPETWSEQMLSELSPGEYDFQEFKGTAWLCEQGKVASHFQAALSKQISAFANATGGRLFIGLDDDGRIDGGVPVDLKRGGVRAWLEDVIPASVEPTLRGFNVYEVPPSGPGSAIHPGHAVFVVDIPASRDAPHMSQDRRYYLRIAGKSRPMSNVHVQDIVRRTNTPDVRLARFAPFGHAEFDEGDPRGPRAFVCFQLFVKNQGRRLAKHVGVELKIPRALVSSVVRERITSHAQVQINQTPGQVLVFRYHQAPVFPEQEICVIRIWVGVHANNLAALQSGKAVSWAIYADDALPVTGSRALNTFRLVSKTIKGVQARLRVAQRRAEAEPTRIERPSRKRRGRPGRRERRERRSAEPRGAAPSVGAPGKPAAE